jgi:hypothetical protein
MGLPDGYLVRGKICKSWQAEFNVCKNMTMIVTDRLNGATRDRI